MRSPSMSRLAELLAERIQFGDEAASAPGAGRSVPDPAIAVDPALPPLEAAPEALLERLEDLSGEQVDALLTVLMQERNDDAR
jgi:hypothetical protein